MDLISYRNERSSSCARKFARSLDDPRLAPTKDDLVILNVSGRGDKDVQQIAEWKAEQGIEHGA